MYLILLRCFIPFKIMFYGTFNTEMRLTISTFVLLSPISFFIMLGVTFLLLNIRVQLFIDGLGMLEVPRIKIKHIFTRR